MKHWGFTMLFIAMTSTTSAFAEGGSDRLYERAAQLTEQRKVTVEAIVNGAEPNAAPVAQNQLSEEAPKKIGG
jgi:hypothetical protein